MTLIGAILIGVGLGIFIPEFMGLTQSKNEEFKRNAKAMTIALIILAIGIILQVNGTNN